MDSKTRTTAADDRFLVARKPSWQRLLFPILLRWLESRIDKSKPIIEQRADLDRASRAMWMPHGVKAEAIRVGNMPAAWITPANAVPGRTILYAHGGGFITGSVHTHRALVARLALACRARGLLFAYRLAPEYAHPAAADDTVAAYKWLLDQQIAPDQIVLMGDSAGGALVLLALLRLRDTGDPLPAAGVCLSPVTDMTGSGESMTRNAKRAVMLKPKDLTGTPQYVGSSDPASGDISPLFADLHGLPPLLILAGTREILLDDSIRFAEKALHAGVDVTLEVWPEMWHVWPVFAPFLPEAVQAIDRIGAFVEAV